MRTLRTKRPRKEKAERGRFKFDLTPVKRSRVKSTILPLVIFSYFCDLTMMNKMFQLSVDKKSYQRVPYAASPIILL